MAFWFFAVQAALLCGASSLLARDHRTSVPIGRSAVLPLLALVGASSSIAEAGVAGGLVLPVLLCSGGLVLLAFAGWADRRSAQRLLPAQALAVRHPIGAGLLTVFALSIATTGFWAHGPLLLKILFGTRPLISGYILAGGALASWSVATVVVAGLPASAGTTLIRCGVSLIAAGASGFALVVPVGSFVGMVICGLLQGVGFGMCWPSIIGRVVRHADEDERVLAAAAPGILQRIGYTVGTAATGIAANAAGLDDGMTAGAAREADFWVFAGFLPILVVGILAAWRFTGPDGRPGRPHLSAPETP